MSTPQPQTAAERPQWKLDSPELYLNRELTWLAFNRRVLNASNSGVPVILDDHSDAGQAYQDMVGRYLGEELPHRFVDLPRKGFFSRLFGG